MFGKHQHHRFWGVFFAACVICFCLCVNFVHVMADAAVLPPQRITLPPDYKYGEAQYKILLYEANEYVVDFKKTLIDYGYYPEAVNFTQVLETKYLDDLTLMAVENCCKENPRLEYDPYGVLDTPTYWSIINRDIKNLNEADEAVDEGYRFINWGDTGENVRHVQQRLYEMRYLDYFETNDTGLWIYGEKTRDALDAFLEANDNDYSQVENNGITVGIQELLDYSPTPSDTPTPAPEPSPEATEKPGVMTRLSNYWSESTELLGLKMPNFAIWLIGLVLVVLIIVAIIHFFVPSSDADKSKRSKGRNRQLSFEITYNGHTENYSCSVQKVLRIGRNVGSFPLNPDDSKISRRHCDIYYEDKQLMLYDYSSNGTTVNGKNVHNSKCLLNSGDTIVIGDHSILLTF